MFGNRNIEALNKKKTPAQRLLGQDRKYFDSGDWVLSKSGKSDAIDTATVGSEHPVPEKIPHLSSPAGTVQQHSHQHHPSSHGTQASSPIKETSFLSQESKPEDMEHAQNSAQSQQPQSMINSNEKLPIRS